MDTFTYDHKECTELGTSYNKLQKTIYRSQGGGRPVEYVPEHSSFLKMTISRQGGLRNQQRRFCTQSYISAFTSQMSQRQKSFDGNLST